MLKQYITRSDIVVPASAALVPVATATAVDAAPCLYCPESDGLCVNISPSSRLKNSEITENLFTTNLHHLDVTAQEDII